MFMRNKVKEMIRILYGSDSWVVMLLFTVMKLSIVVVVIRS